MLMKIIKKHVHARLLGNHPRRRGTVEVVPNSTKPFKSVKSVPNRTNLYNKLSSFGGGGCDADGGGRNSPVKPSQFVQIWYNQYQKVNFPS